MNVRFFVTGAGSFGPEVATSAVTAFGPAGWIFDTLNDNGNCPSRYAFLSSWSTRWPSPEPMPPSTRPSFVLYDTPGSERLTRRPLNWSGVGRSCGFGGGGGSCGSGAPTAANCTCAKPPGGAMEAAIEGKPAAAPPMTANAATVVVIDFMVSPFGAHGRDGI